MIHIGSYNYDGLISSFFAQDRNTAKTAGNRMSYNKTTLYSYNSILAKLVGTTLLIDADIARYSVTSIKHTRKLHTNTPDNIQVFTVASLNNSNETITSYWKSMDYLIKMYERSRKYKQSYVIQITNLYKEILDYMDYVNIDKRTVIYKVSKGYFKKFFTLGILHDHS